MNEFAKYLDFWVEGQKQGFAGALPRIKLPNGSKMVAHYRHPLLYVDNWYGSDLGGGQTLLYKLSEAWMPERPFHIYGVPIARQGYSGHIVKRFSEAEAAQLREIFGDLSQSDIVWKVLKSALAQVSRERPFRGPKLYFYPECRDLFYTSSEPGNPERTAGREDIYFRSGVAERHLFRGGYDFVLIKKNLEDELP